MPQYEPWERQEGESAKAFEAFKTYLDMEVQNRSIRRVALRLSKSATQIRKWSSRWKWVARIEAYDREEDRKYAAERSHQAKLIRKRAAVAANALLEKGLQALKNVDPSDLKPATALKYIDRAVRLGLLASGEPEMIAEQQQRIVNVDSMSPEEQLEELQLLGRAVEMHRQKTEQTLLVDAKPHDNGHPTDAAGDNGQPEE